MKCQDISRDTADSLAAEQMERIFCGNSVARTLRKTAPAEQADDQRLRKMTTLSEQTLLNALAIGEERDWEFKSAKGGLPSSLWETYSAMANTDGGVIVLGVDWHSDHYVASGLRDAARAKKSFWDTVNNRGKVSVNLLSDQQVQVQKVADKQVLVIHVPRATRQQRPVYVGQNPLTGTYRRNFEGDYHCTEQEVGRMLADRAEEPADSRILEGFGIDDLDPASVEQYRNRFSARSPNHPWLAEDLKGFLDRLGGWRADRQTGQEGLTVAGLLMFGKVKAILDPLAVPEFHLDYRERLSDDPQVRWTDRLVWDGTWEANVFQFYQRVLLRLTADLKIPFRLEPDLFRKDETIVHEAVREALVNALIHGDYRGQGGIVIEKYRNRFELSNPGTLLVSFEQLRRGGVSECRNRALQTMFLMIGGGEKAGSGIDKIRQGWRSQHWRSPNITEISQPDRVRIVLPMVSMLPEDSLERLREWFGARLDGLGPLELQALVTAEIEKEVSNARMQEVTTEHPADLTRILQGLVVQGLLRQHGQKRGTSYRLQERSAGDSSRSAPDSAHISGESAHIAEGSAHLDEGAAPETDPALLAIAQPARKNRHLRPETTRQIVFGLCKGRYLTVKQIALLLDRNPNSLRSRFLASMVREGLLDLRFPQEPNRPDQAYTSHIETVGEL